MRSCLRSLGRGDRLAALLAALTTLVLVVSYGPVLGRAFVSEDLLILRLLHRAGVSDGQLPLLLEQFSGPWLDLTLVGFYRPVAHAFLQLQWVLYGTWPLGYGLTHLAMHLMNAALVGWLLERLGQAASKEADLTERRRLRLSAVCGTAVFALHPLHPNAVLFIASFATLVGTFWALLSLHFLVSALRRQQEEHPAEGSASARRVVSLRVVSLRVGSLFAAFLACLSYEQFVVLAPLTILLTGAWAITRGPGLALKDRLPPLFWVVGFAGVVAMHLLLRRAALGESIGGYSSLLARLRLPRVIAGDLWRNWNHWWFPWFGDPSGRWPLSVVEVGLAVATGALLLCLATRLLVRPQLWVWSAVGLLWWTLSQAPFLFVGVVPGNGRYLYFAAAGGALLCQQLVWRLTGGALPARDRWRPRFRASAISVALLLLITGWCLQLGTLLESHSAASRQVVDLRSETLSWAATESLDGRPIGLVGAPPFVVSAGVNVAQLYHWGLADSFLPPWTERSPLLIYALPPLGDRALERLASSGDMIVARWLGDGAQPPVRRVPGGQTTPYLRLNPAAAGSGSLARLVPRQGSTDRLVVTTRGTYVLQTLVANEAQPGSVDVPCPDRVVDSMARLYATAAGANAYWWVERRGTEGRLEALSDVSTLEACPAAAR